MNPGAGQSSRVLTAAVLGLLVAGALALRWPTFGAPLWNVDEAIHATVARNLLDGGTLYRDAIDQRTPLSYYAVAGIFAVAGENNLWAVRFFIALLIAGTGGWLFVAARRHHGGPAGGVAAALYVTLSSILLLPGDAYAANTEWFLAFFSAAAAAVFLSGGERPSSSRVFWTGALLGGAFLSKQPALLEIAAPGLTLGWLAFRGTLTARDFAQRGLALAAGWIAPVLLTVLYFVARGALGDFFFYSWTYNVAYYGPEIATADRLNALLLPFKVLAGSQGLLLVVWLGGGAVALYRLAQRQPNPSEQASAPFSVYLVAWSLSAAAGAASGGRDFGHYVIQFLPPFALGAGLALARLGDIARSASSRRPARLAAGTVALATTGLLLAAIPGQSHRTLPRDPSWRVAGYIREHTAPTDRIFVWGFHPDIYVESGRRAASRFVYASFLSGLIPWTNVAPGRDTTYAIVPGARATLLRELAANPPAFVVDCSAGPNRSWQKYPLSTFPELQDYLRLHYQVVEAGQFVPQGFRLFQRRAAGAGPAAGPAPAELPVETRASLAIGTLGRGIAPASASAPNGASFSLVEGRAEYFAHAPSRLGYPLPAGATALRGGLGIRAAAYAPENRGPTDGAEFIVRWRGPDGVEKILLRRLLRPRDEAADRGVQSFRVEFSPAPGGELWLEITPGPADSPASDWTFWTDLAFETSL